MRVLVIGGTVFLGHHLVETLLARGHHATVFHRGAHPLGLREGIGIEEVHGDRADGLVELPDAAWDAVIDTCGYEPELVARSTAALQRRTGRYLFVSTVSVYDLTHAPIDERSTLVTVPDRALLKHGDGESYGPLKILCEREVQRSFDGRALIVRPGLIVGPRDPTDRFTYWPRRIARGGEVLVPTPADRPLQFIDVRDLAAFIVQALEQSVDGVVNATSPRRVTMGELIEACRTAANADVRLTFVDDEFLEREGVGSWIELPLWIPASANVPGIFACDVSAAVECGLHARPLRETVSATLAWDRDRDPTAPRAAGLDADRERMLLARWHAHQQFG